MILGVDGPDFVGKDTVIQQIRRQLSGQCAVLKMPIPDDTVDVVHGTEADYEHLRTTVRTGSKEEIFQAMMQLNKMALEKAREIDAPDRLVLLNRNLLSTIVYDRGAAPTRNHLVAKILEIVPLELTYMSTLVLLPPWEVIEERSRKKRDNAGDATLAAKYESKLRHYYDEYVDLLRGDHDFVWPFGHLMIAQTDEEVQQWIKAIVNVIKKPKIS